ncbi:protein kti12 homolog [Lichtheimia corymbifera JMRC:FSU:9682]|uniref:Protein kti12 homolog n=1 Tax=Lichtheimia corymbifera JMRC:FSU:9682 TaxID=1263082 RepID=A0A068RQK6_9FUNG|nr:protein kti12 homolog [Lichtheimia corymbifera JMRC:FSU:9682]
MPLIVLTGHPCSGKSQRAHQIKQYMLQRLSADGRSMRIHIVNDDSLNVSKEAYREAREEKKARGALLSAVFDISFTVLHVLLVHCGTPVAMAKEWNKARGEAGYDEQVFDELVTRYEEPDARNRWDSPLFTVIFDDADVPGDKMWDAVILRKPPPPNQSTISKPVSTTNYVYELDKVTLEIINAVVEGQKEFGAGGMPMVVPRASQKVINPSRTVTLSELRRLRKQFVSINKMRTTLDTERLADIFVEYLNTNLE